MTNQPFCACCGKPLPDNTKDNVCDNCADELEAQEYQYQCDLREREIARWGYDPNNVPTPKPPKTRKHS